MEYLPFDPGRLRAAVRISRFRGLSGAVEYHLVIRPTEYGSIDRQLDLVLRAYREALGAIGLDTRTALLRRFCCSDLPNQAAVLEACALSSRHNQEEPCAVSWVSQPPVAPAKVVLWAYHLDDPTRGIDKALDGETLTLRRGALRHHFTTGITNAAPGESSYEQTWKGLEKYEAFLNANQLSLASNVIRTWLYVRNIDVNYQGMVAARRRFFAERGLGPDTHFIASSGIEGGAQNVAANVLLDAYAISGVRPEQIAFLKALDHLSPAHLYGVTFERGTSITYRDRKHVFISGTASIDARGEVLYPGDLSRQLDRTLDNIEALLENAGATLDDMGTFVVYIRDPSDHELAGRKMQERFSAVPIQLVVAPVCRPAWLIEVEGQATIPASAPQLPEY